MDRRDHQHASSERQQLRPEDQHPMAASIGMPSSCNSTPAVHFAALGAPALHSDTAVVSEDTASPDLFSDRPCMPSPMLTPLSAPSNQAWHDSSRMTFSDMTTVSEAQELSTQAPTVQERIQEEQVEQEPSALEQIVQDAMPQELIASKPIVSESAVLQPIEQELSASAPAAQESIELDVAPQQEIITHDLAEMQPSAQMITHDLAEQEPSEQPASTYVLIPSQSADICRYSPLERTEALCVPPDAYTEQRMAEWTRLTGLQRDSRSSIPDESETVAVCAPTFALQEVSTSMAALPREAPLQDDNDDNNGDKEEEEAATIGECLAQEKPKESEKVGEEEEGEEEEGEEEEGEEEEGEEEEGEEEEGEEEEGERNGAAHTTETAALEAEMCALAGDALAYTQLIAEVKAESQGHASTPSSLIAELPAAGQSPAHAEEPCEDEAHQSGTLFVSYTTWPADTKPFVSYSSWQHGVAPDTAADADEDTPAPDAGPPATESTKQQQQQQAEEAIGPPGKKPRSILEESRPLTAEQVLACQEAVTQAIQHVGALAAQTVQAVLRATPEAAPEEAPKEAPEEAPSAIQLLSPAQESNMELGDVELSSISTSSTPAAAPPSTPVTRIDTPKYQAAADCAPTPPRSTADLAPIPAASARSPKLGLNLDFSQPIARISFVVGEDFTASERVVMPADAAARAVVTIDEQLTAASEGATSSVSVTLVAHAPDHEYFN